MKSAIPSHGKLDGVQFGRAIAACFVVFYHTGRMLMLPQYTGHGSLGKDIFAFGNAGVDFFFTLSGFIIFYVHQSDINQPLRLRHYIGRRITRIYPMYWAVTAVVIALAALKHDWVSLNAVNLAKSILLLPGLGDPLLGVGWTLQHEVLFYAVFALAIVSRPAGIFVGAIWLGFVVVEIFYPVHGRLLGFIRDPYHLDFAFGILAAIAAKKWQSSHSWLAALLGIVVFGATAALVDRHVWIDKQLSCRLLFGIASAFVLFGVSVSELRGQIGFPRWMSYLGAASYSIYLVHTLAIGFLAHGVFHFSAARESPNLVFFGVALLAIAIGCAAYQFIQVPLQAAIRRPHRFRRSRELSPAIPK
jgi:exopolysaccharide production protein ExoZ